MCRLSLILILFSFINGVYSQEIASTPDEFEKQYNLNIRKSKINGFYIPKDFSEAVAEFIKLSPPESVQKFKFADEDTVVKKLHFGLGKWLATNWNFYEGSRFSHMLRMKGIADPNDMIQVTLRSIHRSLNSKPIDIDAQAEAIRILRKKEHAERMKSGEIIEQKTNPIDSSRIKIKQ